MITTPKERLKDEGKVRLELKLGCLENQQRIQRKKIGDLRGECKGI
jgi:hypothetical protein